MDGRRVGGAAVLAFFSLFVGIRGEVRLEVLKGRFQTSHGGELTSWSNLDLRFAPRMGRNSEFRVYPRGLDGIDRFYRTDDPWKIRFFMHEDKFISPWMCIWDGKGKVLRKIFIQIEYHDETLTIHRIRWNPEYYDPDSWRRLLSMGERFSGDYFDLEYSWKKVKAAEDKLHFFRYHNNADDPSIDRALGLTFAILLIIYFAEFLLRKAKAVSKSDSSQKVE